MNNNTFIDTLEERELEGECSTTVTINTTFNSDTRVPTYTGIMFEIFPRMDLELLTIELDLRIPEDEVEDADLSVELYTMQGSYELLKAYSENRWSLVTKGTAVILPGGQGAIIPATEFTPFKIEAKERRSFYVTMKRSYLDHNVMALQKTGELQMRTPELDILVGVGFHQYKFPGDYDRLLDPQFAGVLHLQRTAECELLTTTTTVELVYIVEAEATAQLLTDLSNSVDQAIADLLAADSDLQRYQNEFNLQVNQKASSSRKEYEGGCPEGWKVCPSDYLRSSVEFLHSDMLESGRLLYQLYLATEKVSNTIQRNFGEKRIYYLGQQSVSADLTLVLDGIPPGKKMDSVQVDYVEHVATTFLQENTDSTIRVMGLEISQQTLTGSTTTGERSRLLQRSANQLQGIVLGAQTIQYSGDNFQGEIEQTFDKDEDIFLNRLVVDGLRPGEINEQNRIEYFESLSSVESKVTVHTVARKIGSGSEATKGSKGLVVAILVSLLGVGAVFAVWWYARKRFEEDEKKRDKKEMMRFRRQREFLDRKTNGSPPSLSDRPTSQSQKRDASRASTVSLSPVKDSGSHHSGHARKQCFARSGSCDNISTSDTSPTSQSRRRSRSLGDGSCHEDQGSNRSLSSFLEKNNSERKITKQGSSMSIQSTDNPSVSYSIGNYSSMALPPPRTLGRTRDPKPDGSGQTRTPRYDGNDNYLPMALERQGIPRSRSFDDREYGVAHPAQGSCQFPHIAKSPADAPHGRGYFAGRMPPAVRGVRRTRSWEPPEIKHDENARSVRANQRIIPGRGRGGRGMSRAGSWDPNRTAGEIGGRGNAYGRGGRGVRLTRSWDPNKPAGDHQEFHSGRGQGVSGGRGAPYGQSGRGMNRARSWDPNRTETDNNPHHPPVRQYYPGRGEGEQFGRGGPGGRGNGFVRQVRVWDPSKQGGNSGRFSGGRGRGEFPGRGAPYGRGGRGAPSGRGVRRVRSWDPGHSEPVRSVKTPLEGVYYAGNHRTGPMGQQSHSEHSSQDQAPSNGYQKDMGIVSPGTEDCPEPSSHVYSNLQQNLPVQTESPQQQPETRNNVDAGQPSKNQPSVGSPLSLDGVEGTAETKHTAEMHTSTGDGGKSEDLVSSCVPRPRVPSSPGRAHDNANNAPPTRVSDPQQRLTPRNDSDQLNAVDFPAYSPPEVKTKVVRKSRSFDSVIVVQSNKTNAPGKAKPSKPKKGQAAPVAKKNTPARRVVDI